MGTVLAVTPGASIELAERLLGRRCSDERPITVDQTNLSVVVDESVVVKWLRPPVPAPHPGVQLIRHLAAAGFEEMPAFLG
ncbi:MAG: aminoglycoside phosphotransferase, partial [Actinomycetota bacterium]|nr:aminoglycoside phosphotransferase [Actinomycetota bacterium]